MKTLVEKPDSDLKSDVLAELTYEPTVSITDIGVLVKDGTVTLNGYATSYGEKWNAVTAAKRVAGVRAIADDIIVKTPHSPLRTDGDIASAALTQIGWFTSIPKGAVQTIVSEGWLTLEGEVDRGYQKRTAEDYVRHMTGVKGITNLLTIKKSKLAPVNIKSAIERAFERSALLDAKKSKSKRTTAKSRSAATFATTSNATRPNGSLGPRPACGPWTTESIRSRRGTLMTKRSSTP